MKKAISKKPFINRTKEIKGIEEYLKNIPDSVLFVYGPKSTGKSTLLNKVVNNLDPKKYAVNYLNLRGVIIYNFKTFLNVFFPKSLKGKVKDILEGVRFNSGFFGVSLEEESLLEENAFKVMEDKIISATKRDIKPIIIIDEIQLLKNIYLNGERYLLNEIFNLFIRLTKETHLCHVICATSDSYFIEQIYNSASMSKTCTYYLIDHLGKEDTLRWLKKYPKRFPKEKDIKYVWDHLGGSPWELWQVIEDVKGGESIEKAVEKRIEDLDGRVFDFYAFKKLPESQEKDFKRISKEIAKKGFYTPKESDDLSELIPKTVEKDIWFYDATKKKITANSKSLEKVFGRLFFLKA